MCDETYFIPHFMPDPDNVLVYVSVQIWFNKKEIVGFSEIDIEKYQEEKNSVAGYIVLSRVGEQYNTLFYFDEIIENDGMYFLTLSQAIKYNIIPHTEFMITHLEISKE